MCPQKVLEDAAVFMYVCDQGGFEISTCYICTRLFHLLVLSRPRKRLEQIKIARRKRKGNVLTFNFLKI